MLIRVKMRFFGHTENNKIQLLPNSPVVQNVKLRAEGAPSQIHPYVWYRGGRGT